MTSFYLGIVYGFLAVLMVQDYQGKSAYLQIVQNHWVDIYWGWWLIPMILISCLEIACRRRK